MFRLRRGDNAVREVVKAKIVDGTNKGKLEALEIIHQLPESFEE